MTTHQIRECDQMFYVDYTVDITDAPDVPERAWQKTSRMLRPDIAHIRVDFGALDGYNVTFRGWRVLKDGRLSDKERLAWRPPSTNPPEWARAVLATIRDHHLKHFQDVIELIVEKRAGLAIARANS